LLPEDALGLGSAGTPGGVEIERDFDKALKQAQVAMMLRIQRERLAGLELDLGDYVARYQLNEGRLMACAPNGLVMHPGPMIRGLEIAGEVADGPNSAIEEQVRHGLAVRTALLVRALGVGGFESVTV
jgi:aspartate carbamoyltransferase catalytic subunit